jgi:hypothetical protein
MREPESYMSYKGYIVTKARLADGGFGLIECDGGWSECGYFPADQVRYECNREANKPCVTVEAHERWRNFGWIDNFNLNKEAGQAREGSRD